MMTKLVYARSATYTSRWGTSDKTLDEQIATAVEEAGSPPTEVHFAASQTTSNGGQNSTFAALLVWREALAPQSATCCSSGGGKNADCARCTAR